MCKATLDPRLLCPDILRNSRQNLLKKMLQQKKKNATQQKADFMVGIFLDFPFVAQVGPLMSNHATLPIAVFDSLH